MDYEIDDDDVDLQQHRASSAASRASPSSVASRTSPSSVASRNAIGGGRGLNCFFGVRKHGMLVVLAVVVLLGFLSSSLSPGGTSDAGDGPDRTATDWKILRTINEAYYSLSNGTGQRQPLWDVHAPPVHLNGTDTLQSLLDAGRDANLDDPDDFSKELEEIMLLQQQSQQQMRRTVGPTAAGGAGTVGNGGMPPYPVVQDDGKIPDGAAAQQLVLSPVASEAANALVCRKSVVNFVINATDVKDECEGLKKAFDKTCSNDDEEEAGQGGTSAGGNNGIRRMRHLLGRGQRQQQNPSNWPLLRETVRRHRDNAYLFAYRHYRWFNRLARRLEFGKPAFFFAEDSIVEAYDDATCVVNNDLDSVHHRDLQLQFARDRMRAREEEHRKKRQLEENAVDNGGGVGDAVANPIVNVNKTRTSTFPKSLALPTASKHVSEKVASETLLLHQGDKAIEKAHNESQKNANNENAKQDAKASSKAMADANAAVSALLNDPSSIEARTCCASILNVYHENCSTDEEEELSDSRLFFVVFVMATCGIVKSLIRHFRILWMPEAAGCILVGGTCQFTESVLRYCMSRKHSSLIRSSTFLF